MEVLAQKIENEGKNTVLAMWNLGNGDRGEDARGVVDPRRFFDLCQRFEHFLRLYPSNYLWMFVHRNYFEGQDSEVSQKEKLFTSFGGI
jgi:hypothetical protein